MLKRRGKTLKNQAELSWETGPLLIYPHMSDFLNIEEVLQNQREVWNV